MLDNRQRQTLLAGGILILIGAGFFVVQLLSRGGIVSWIPFVAGLVLIVVALLTKVPGLSVLGCVLSGGGAGLVWYTASDLEIAGTRAGAVFFLFLSGGFLLATPVTLLLDGKALKWPLVPGLVGVAVGVAFLLPVEL
ncbi:MAG: hypothetical protein CMN78_00315 [Spirochaetales bacterium]|nr:hypothetical protein [Spirochaetales bacterium]